MLQGLQELAHHYAQIDREFSQIAIEMEIAQAAHEEALQLYIEKLAQYNAKRQNYVEALRHRHYEFVQGVA